MASLASYILMQCVLINIIKLKYGRSMLGVAQKCAEHTRFSTDAVLRYVLYDTLPLEYIVLR